MHVEVRLKVFRESQTGVQVEGFRRTSQGATRDFMIDSPSWVQMEDLDESQTPMLTTFRQQWF